MVQSKPHDSKQEAREKTTVSNSVSSGYYRSPALAGDQVIFVSEDDLWTVPVLGGMARRLSSGLGKVSSPAVSHDGQWLAFTSTEEGHAEVFLMPAEGGEATRLTHLGCETRVVGWTREGEILFASNHQQAFARLTDMYALHPATRKMRKIPCGHATHLDFDERGRMVIARHGGTDLAYWKRYRGGRAGQIWIDKKGDGNFEELLQQPANSARPYWIKDRVFFISDHEGVGNIYSVDLSGGSLTRHTDCREFYARGLSVSGTRLVFHTGADLYILDADPAALESASESTAQPRKIEIDFRSPRTQLNRRFVSAGSYLEDYELDPLGESAVIAARGKTFSFDLWQGPVFMHGHEGAMRYRLGRFLKDGQRIVLLSDAGGEEAVEIHDRNDRAMVERLTGLELGRTLDMKLSPVADEALLVNHRNELHWVDLTTHDHKILDRCEYARIRGFNWSPDGRWVAYSSATDERTSAIRVCEIKTGEIHTVTRPVLRDVRPYFDPEGEYLYFLSYREFDPVYDNLHFDLGFVRGCKPYLVTLRKDVMSPFNSAHPGRSNSKSKEKRDRRDGEKTSAAKTIDIDFDGIEDRVVAFPLSDGRYGQIAATREKLYYTRLPIKGSLRSDTYANEPSADAQLEMFDLETERIETIANNVSSFRVSLDGKQIIYRAGNSLRVVKAGEKPGRDNDDYRRGGWLDLERVQIPIRPKAEWRQIYREAWRLQRDHFWTESMSKVDWNRVFNRYSPLLDRVGSRSEVSDVIWEMQGELGTSHAYEIGGDYRTDPNYGIGFLGVETEYDESEKAFRISKVMKGDLWDETCSSPLARAGIGLKAGDLLLAIDGQQLHPEFSVHQALLHRAGKEVAVTFRRQGETEAKTLPVRTLRSEQKLRYREWVNGNRAWVHAQSSGRVGYLHVPNMGPFGYSEFHRSFLTELDRDALIIDVRYNGGGHVSQLLLEKLARRRIGYSKSRWFGVQPYPEEAPVGHMVALTNEYAGSDGDIFSHAFKLLKLGPLIGKRTWGGVIGISPSHSLVDGGMTTQPEYSFWFADVGWKVENYGTDPDLEVEIAPSAIVAGRDPQLERALAVCQEQLNRQPPFKPTLEDEPDLSLPDFLPGVDLA